MIQTGRIPPRSRIYPVPVKPASGITTWSGWPDDVRPIMRWWNSGHSSPEPRPARRRSLSFLYAVNTFKCPGCERFCFPDGATNCELDGEFFCDDCVVGLARIDLGMARASAVGAPVGSFRGVRFDEEDEG